MTTPTVNILPWAHALTFKPQAEIIRIITSRIPKGSILAMEVTHHDLQSFYHLMNSPSGARTTPQPIANKYRNIMHLELLLACAKRGIRIVPIESRGLHREYGRFNYARHFPLDDLSTQFRLIGRRDANSARVISRIAAGKQKSVFALVGFNHVPGLQDQLRQKGISSRVRTELFKEDVRSYFTHVLPLVRKDYIAWKSGVAENKLGEHSHKRSIPIPQRRKLEVNEHANVIAQNILERQQTQHKRAELKLRERKGEHGLRKRLSRRPKGK